MLYALQSTTISLHWSFCEGFRRLIQDFCLCRLPNRLFGDQLIKLPLGESVACHVQSLVHRKQVFNNIDLTCLSTELLTGVFLLWRNLRFAGLFGLLVPSLLMIPSQMLVKRVKSTQAELMQATDVRVQLTNEVLTNIKHVKSMAYEDAYTKKIMRAREQELEAMRRNQICKALMMTISVIGPAFTLFAALAWYTKIQRQVLTPSVAFSSVLVAEMLRRSIRVRLML
jgi:ABC-type bacteriocin/lantibiotic exporter with double-glycine peptidase domain